jgi:hypothetical protein
MNSFAEFWPYYLQAHARRGTRALHYFATSLAILLLIFMVVTGNYWLAVLLPIASYSIAWASHFGVEGNRPATFRHPLWALRGDFLMLWRWVTGRIGDDMRGVGVAPDGSIDPARRLF